MTPYYEHGGITIYHGDCREILPALKADVVVTDPPYGICYDTLQRKQRNKQAFRPVNGDDEQFDPLLLLGFSDLICWGANHYSHLLPVGKGQFYVWDKVCRNGLNVRIAECEFAWHLHGTKPRVFRHLWSGAYRASEAGQKSVHPTQKPIALMAWCLSMVSEGIMADPFCGSGSSLVAAHQMGRRAIGIEIEERYCEIAAERLAQDVLPLERDA